MVVRSVHPRYSPVFHVVVLVALVLALMLMGLLYWWLVQPLTMEGVRGQRSREYEFSIYGSGGDLLRRPSSVGVALNGDIHVADTGKHRIVVFNKRGRLLETYGDAGREELQVWQPIDVAVADDGRAYVLDKGLRKVVIYDLERQPQKELTFEEYPLSVTTKGDRLYVTTESGVLVGALNGDFITGYIARGQAPGQFDKPGGVAVDAKGNLYVADSFNYRVQAISKAGEPLWQYGTPLPPDTAIENREPSRKLGLPASIALGSDGYLYVVDGTNSEIVVLSTDGELIDRIGEQGHDDGFFYYPDGVDTRGRLIVVADKFNDRVEVFSMPPRGIRRLANYAPWALLALPLLLLLLRRRPTYITTREFLEELRVHEALSDVARGIGRVVITEQIAADEQLHDDLDIAYSPHHPADADVRDVAERFVLADDAASALALAIETSGRRTLLTNDDRLRAAAAVLKIPTLTLQNLVDAAEGGPLTGGWRAPRP